MPVQACQEEGRPGWRWGDQGKCYTYAPGDDAASGQAKRKAYVQGAAIGKRESFSTGGEMRPKPFVPEDVSKQSPDAGDVHADDMSLSGGESNDRRKKARRASDQISTVKGDVAGHDFHAQPESVKVDFFWVEKSEQPQQIVRGIVLVPDLIDSQGEVVRAGEIEKAAHQWMLDWQQQGVQHYGDHLPEIRPVESYLAPADFVIKGVDGADHTVPKGTWVMASKVGSQQAWEMVMNRRLSGYSIQGSAIKHEVSL